jgi:hypothetical protein
MVKGDVIGCGHGFRHQHNMFKPASVEGK